MLARSLLLSCLLALEAPAQYPLIPPYNIGLPSGCSVIDFNGKPAIVIAVPGYDAIASLYYPVPPYITKTVALRIEAIMVVDYRPAAQGLSWDIAHLDWHQASYTMPASGVDLRVPFGMELAFNPSAATANYTNRYCRMYQSCPLMAPQWTLAICTVTLY